METELLKIETPRGFEAAVTRAAELLQAGELVAVPTETVYGLAANALNPEAVQKIFAVKGRSLRNPLIVHVCSLDLARECVRSWPESAALLATAFWPGPLTMVLPKADRIPSIVTAGGGTVAVRWPLHPFMRELIRRCAFPIAAPSANPANQLSPSDASHVLRGLSGKIPLIVDAGPANVGIESTVVDLTSNPPRILRPGMLSREQIKQVLGVHVESAAESGGVLKSPGLMGRHYSPRAPLRVERWAGDEELERIAKASDVPLEKIHVLAHERIPHRGGYGRIAVIPHDPEAFARALYAELHRCDEMEASLILVEAPPSGPAWEGIQDRLKRASAPV